MLKYVLLTIEGALAAYEESVGKVPFTKEFESLIKENQAKLTAALKGSPKSTVEASTPGA